MRQMLAILALWALSVTGARAQEAPPAPQPAARELGAALRRLASQEPGVGSVVTAAVAQLRVHPDRVGAAVTRARLSGLLPTVRLGGRRGQGWDHSALLEADRDRSNYSVDDELSLELTVVLPLDRLLFARDEVALLREQRAAEAARAELVRMIIRLYFERRRLILERDLLGRRDLDHVIRIAEITALLDGFTAGGFSRMMAASHRRRP